MVDAVVQGLEERGGNFSLNNLPIFLNEKNFEGLKLEVQGKWWGGNKEFPSFIPALPGKDMNWVTVAPEFLAYLKRVVEKSRDIRNVSFEDVGAKTKVRLVWTPLDASQAELDCFAGAMNNMGKGWESGYEIMDQIFAELQSS